MDLLYQRYASPFSFLDIAISQKRFSECVDLIIDKNEERNQWEYYLHRVFDGCSFFEFRERMKQQAQIPKKIDFEATMLQSKDILNGFNPTRKEESSGTI